LNPMGQVPALSDGDFVLTESWAINLYLAKKAGGPLAPKDVQEEALCEMWTLFAATQIEKPALDAFIQRFVKPATETDHALVAASLKQVERPLTMLDDALAKGGGWLLGERCTVADINVGGAIFYFRRSLEDLAAFKSIKAWWAKLTAMPGYRHAMALRGE
jgi:glutathione S-transferase